MLIANIFLKNGEVIPYDRFSMNIPSAYAMVGGLALRVVQPFYF